MPRWEESHVAVSPSLLAQLAAGGGDPGEAQDTAELLSRWLRIKGLVADAVESMDDEDRTIIEALFWEGATLDEVAYRIGVGHRSTVLRKRDRALAVLKRKLEVTECPILWRQHCSAARPSRSRTRSRT